MKIKIANFKLKFRLKLIVFSLCKQEKIDPLISELIQLISYERHLRGPAPEISFIVVKSLSSSLKSFHILKTAKRGKIASSNLGFLSLRKRQTFGDAITGFPAK